MKPSDRYVPRRGSKWDGLLEGVARELTKAFPLQAEPESAVVSAEHMMEQPVQQQQAEPAEADLLGEATAET
jgi:hypothetical protein